MPLNKKHILRNLINIDLMEKIEKARKISGAGKPAG
jgi:hypothetical protein